MNNFPEKKLGKNFCQKEIMVVKKLIDQSVSFTTVGLPGMGISLFLRYLATQRFAYFIHLDINELSKLTKDNFFKLLDKNHLINLTKYHGRVVVIFNRFDRMKKHLDQDFIARLRVLRDLNKEKIIFIFAANRPLTQQAPTAFLGGNLNLGSKDFYLPLYQLDDLQKLTLLNTPNLAKRHPNFKQALKLSGGHYQFLQLLLKSDYPFSQILEDPVIKLQLKELYDFLTYKEQLQLKAIILGKKIEISYYLIKTGFVVKQKDSHQLFSPLMNRYVQARMKMRLSAEEEKLFHFLKKNLGEVVSKEEIFQAIWGVEDVTDWALDALIYRLRKNPSFIASGYSLINQKKIGYQLLRS